MYRSGVAHRRSYAVVVIIAAIAIAAWLIQAQLGNSTKKTPASRAAAAAAPAPAANEAAAPQAGDTGANAAAPGADGYGAGGDYGNAAGAQAGAPAAATVTAKRTKSLTVKSIPRMGQVVVDDEGFVLYRFDRDAPNPPVSNCTDACAQKWPPVTLEDGAKLTGLDSTKVGSITRPDGVEQVTLGNWALYRYSGDTKAGGWKGQNVGGVWFAVAADGKKNLTCIPSNPPAP
jgi:predicted lipoprotein with Yx(FWY)xxD motif